MTGISKMEAAAIRENLELRFDTQHGYWEVYTTMHGSGVYRWFIISETTARWYFDNFPEIKNKYVHAYESDRDSGAMNRYDELVARK